jgi:cyclase
MKRVHVLGTLVAAGVMSIAVSAAQQPQGAQAPRVVEVEKLHDNLFVLRGGGGHTAVFVQSKGVTVVDTKNPGWGKPLLDTIRELTDKPVTMIVNTHSHGDHVSGNVEFPSGVQVVAHDNTKQNMARMLPPPAFPQPAAGTATIFEQHKGHGLPAKTFTDRLTLGSGADRIELYYFGRGHTNGDTMVVFPAHGVMHMGDLFPGRQLPIMDSNNGGSGVEYAGTLRKAHDGVKDVRTIITGHGPTMTPKDLLEFSQFVGEFADGVRAAKKAGRTIDQAVEGWTMPAKYSGYAAPQPAFLRMNVTTIYQELP